MHQDCYYSMKSHTYEGLQGAHIAYLLRRWRHARRYGQPAHLCCVGLSATLKSADTFFAKLTGLPQHRVKYIHPSDEDMEIEGAEYNVMLKGDPASGTAYSQHLYRQRCYLVACSTPNQTCHQVASMDSGSSLLQIS